MKTTKRLYSLLILLIFCCSTFAQTSGAGEIINYATTQWGCGAPECNLNTNPEDIYLFVMPVDGRAILSATCNSYQYTCCGFSSEWNNAIRWGAWNNNQIASTLTTFQGPGNFTDIVDNINAGDSLYVRAYGNAGTYSFNVTFENNLTCDVEPNNNKIEATPISFNETVDGCLKLFGTGIVTDIEDWFDIGHLNEDDTIVINAFQITSSRQFFQLYDENSTQFIDQVEMDNIASASYEFVAETSENHYLRIWVDTWNSNSEYQFDLEYKPAIEEQEYVVDTDYIEIVSDQYENHIKIEGNFSGKTMYIINENIQLVESLNNRPSPVYVNVNTLPTGKHFLVIRDFANPLLELVDQIKQD